MAFRSRRFNLLLAGFMVFFLTIGLQSSFAKDISHVVSGVVKTADGTEHTIKWTDGTVVKGTKDTGKDVEKGSVDTYMGAKDGTKVTVKYTEKGGEKTAVGIKDASKATAKAVSQ